MDRAAVQVALGLEPDLSGKHEKYSMIRYIELPAGKTVREVMDSGDIRQLPGVVFMHTFVKPGDKTEPLTHSALRPACVLAEAGSRIELLLKMEEYIKLLTERIILT